MTKLLIDCNYMTHRAYYALAKTMKLAFVPSAPVAVYGFLKTVVSLADDFEPSHIAFCFDRKPLLRQKEYPAYKMRDVHNSSWPERASHNAIVTVAVDLLREKVLPAVGFRNIFHAPGYEADDVIASLVQAHGEECVLMGLVMVSADKDLYQLLRKGRPVVSQYDPQKKTFYTDSQFRKEWGFAPERWSEMKAIMGCHSDCVAGVGGVGEVYAGRYLRDEAVHDGVRRKIEGNAGKEIIRRNTRLVKLPFEGCPLFEWQEEKVSRAAWRATCRELGMPSLENYPPIPLRGLRRLCRA